MGQNLKLEWKRIEVGWKSPTLQKDLGFKWFGLFLSRIQKLQPGHCSSIWKKFDTLQSKPSEMSFEKELLNAVVCRLDALEAELIATKKAIHEALTRQDELLQ